jgi:hypothetical protein
LKTFLLLPRSLFYHLSYSLTGKIIAQKWMNGKAR